jgi:DNA-binding MarR family transcriptional regulator
MKDVKDNQSISWMLMQLMFQSKHRLNHISEMHDITTMQSAALRLLSKDEPKPMRYLSDYFMCDASTVTGLVDRLEAHDLITRSQHATDRRVKLIGLSEKGVTVKEAILEETLKAETERLDTILSSDERTTLRDILLRLLDEDTKTLS